MQVPEKTFLQKYWLYLVIALGAVRTLLLLLSMGPLLNFSVVIAPGGEEGARAP